MLDDNERILELIKERLAVGEKRYGHGLRNQDNTKQWGTKRDSWLEMGLEEILDLSIYIATALIRYDEVIADLEKQRDLLKQVLKNANPPSDN